MSTDKTLKSSSHTLRNYFCIQWKTVHDDVRMQGKFPQFKFLPFPVVWV